MQEGVIKMVCRKYMTKPNVVDSQLIVNHQKNGLLEKCKDMVAQKPPDLKMHKRKQTKNLSLSSI